MIAQQYKGKAKGSLTIIGNGPSLNEFDLEKCEHPTMAMNGISTIFDRTSWRPTFYICVSSACKYESYKEVMQPSIDNSICSFVHKKSVIANDKTILLERDPELVWHDDILDKVGVFGTSTLACFQIAAWLGFDSIRMIGFDGGYKEKANGKFTHYFSEDYPPLPYDKSRQRDWDQINRDQQTALSFGIEKLKERGIKVIRHG